MLDNATKCYSYVSLINIQTLPGVHLTVQRVRLGSPAISIINRMKGIAQINRTRIVYS